jgi:ferredoxin
MRGPPLPALLDQYRFRRNEPDGSQCVLCGGCVDVCPENCIQLVPLERIQFDAEVLEEISGQTGVLRVELDDVAAEELGVITGSAMLKDETRCIRCGLCAERCPVSTITMEPIRCEAAAMSPLACQGNQRAHRKR